MVPIHLCGFQQIESALSTPSQSERHSGNSIALPAMAASMWLDRTQLGYSLNIGVRKNAADELEAHAWLTSGDMTVTGDLPDLERFSIIPLESGISRF